MGLGSDLRTTSQRRYGLGYRVRQMKQGPDGYMYILTDLADGHLIRIAPVQ
jgi:glucose/arabinose dehydrogenase